MLRAENTTLQAENDHNLRVLHAASLMRPSSGQLQQMNWEQQAADELKMHWHARMYCPEVACEKSEITVFDEQNQVSANKVLTRLNLVLKKLAPFRWLLMRRNYHRWLARQMDGYDIVIMRYYVHDVFQWLFVRQTKKTVLFYSHTLEVPELKMTGGFAASIRANLEALIGPLCLAKADGILGVTSEVIDYQVTRVTKIGNFTYEYPNGVLDIPETLVDNRSNTIPEFLFVANFLPWHGLDDLIQSIKMSPRQMTLHVVGLVPEDIKTSCAADSRIVLHGQKNVAEIQKLSEICWVGISSLRLDRKGAKKAATLKAPMYLSLGLPVFGYGDVLPDTLIHYRQGGPDIELLLEFALKNRCIEKEKIQKDSRPFIDKRLLLTALYGCLNDSFDAHR